MITTGFLNIFYYLVTALFSVLPENQTLPTALHVGAQSIGSWARVYNSIFPVDTIITIIGLTFLVVIVVLSFKTALWTIKTIRG